MDTADRHEKKVYISLPNIHCKSSAIYCSQTVRGLEAGGYVLTRILEDADAGENVILSAEDLGLYIPKLVQRTAVIRCLARQTADDAQPKKPAAIACPKFPDVSWWGNIGHQSVMRYVDRKYGGDWKPYIA